MKIVLIGDIMIDETWYCECTRLSPEAPVPVASLVNKVEVLGGAGNVANNLRALSPDAEIHLCGWLGHKYGHMLDERNIRLWPGGWIPSKRTNIKLRIVDNNKGYHLVRVDNEDSVGCLDQALPYEKIINWVSTIQPDSIIISDYLKGTITYKLAKLLISHKHKSQIFVDTRRADVGIFRDADWLTPNKYEYDKMVKYLYTSTNTPQPNLLDSLRLKGILLTRGSEGMDLLQTQRLHIDPTNRDIIDVTGAGDTALAAFTVAKTIGYTNEEALWLANCIAGEVCMSKGTTIPSKTLEEYYSDYGHTKEEEK